MRRMRRGNQEEKEYDRQSRLRKPDGKEDIKRRSCQVTKAHLSWFKASKHRIVAGFRRGLSVGGGCPRGQRLLFEL